jgi:signal transduction histidine kinase
MSVEDAVGGDRPMCEEVGLTAAELERRKRYLAFDAGDERRLRDLNVLAADYAEPIIERFYQHLLSFEETRAYFEDPRLLGRVKRAQTAYFLRLTGGSYDLSYAEERLRIGAAHETVGLDVKYYLGAYCVYLGEVESRLARAWPDDQDRAHATYVSLLKLVFLDIGLAIDTYIDRRERTLGRANQLEAANRELEAFSYSVSHDLRAPLRAILGFSQALAEDWGDRLDEEARSYLDFIVQGGQRMSQLIEDLLRLARLNQSELRMRPVCLSDVARSAADPLLAATDRDIELRVQPGIWASGDDRLLRVVFENLLGNAFKFTSGHSTARIQVGAQEQDGVISVYVRDDGAGFDMANASRLFGPFQRLHADSEFEGSGIGLATVMRIVRRHGGRIWAEGTPERGATFALTLPDLRIEGSEKEDA